jgi:branched-chain amino acid aminotransferase
MTPQPFDNRPGHIWMDGAFLPWTQAHAHVLTHGLHYASAVFEGARAYEGAVFKLEEHTKRLFESAKILDMRIPFAQDEINSATRKLLEMQGHRDAYVRPLVWRGSEMMGVGAPATKIHVAVAIWQWPAYFDPALRLKGLRLEIAEWKRPAPDTAPTKAKAAGLYMICTLARHAAERNGFNDAMMLDYRGQVAEATGANIFFVRDGALHTPTPDCFLDGITRRTVMDLAQKRQIKVFERAIFPDEMKGFEQCFLTGTAVEVAPVAGIGPYGFTIGEITRTLMADYDAAVRAHSIARVGPLEASRA